MVEAAGISYVANLFDTRRSGRPWASPWAALALAWMLFDVPSILAPDRLSPGAMRPTGEILAVITLWALSFRLSWGRTLRRGLAVVTGVMLVLQVDRAVFFVAARAEPLLYDQLFMLRHLFVLLSDLWSWQVALSMVGIVVAIWLGARAGGALMRRAEPLATATALPRTLRVLGVVWALTLALTIANPKPPARPLVRWLGPELATNLSESLRVYRGVQRAGESPYRRYDQIRLSRKPDVFLLFVESYGRLLAEHPATRTAWAGALREMEERLAARGFHTVSAFGTAPISGGRSWLAVGSILMGTTVRYEAVLEQLLDDIDAVPNLVRFFADHGYETVHLAPSDRVRPGIVDVNQYRYDRYVRFDDLDYRGRRMGWGIVPDQYALGFTDERILSLVDRPLFFHFHMVSSHAPWRPVLEVVPDWRTLSAGSGAPKGITKSEIGKRLKRYSRQGARNDYMGDLTRGYRDDYLACVLYDLAVIEDYLPRWRRADTLFVVMGDHQPPVVAPENQSFDVPIHVFSRDPALLDEFRERGFSNGLVVDRERPPAVKHEALFSLLVRVLSRASGAPLPPYLPDGFRLDGS